MRIPIDREIEVLLASIAFGSSLRALEAVDSRKMRGRNSSKYYEILNEQIHLQAKNAVGHVRRLYGDASLSDDERIRSTERPLQVGDPLLAMLIRLRERPAMYIGRYSAEALFTFLLGYSVAVHDLTFRDTTKYEAFIEALYAKYGRGGGGHSWAYVLGQATGGDAAALDLFFAELESFLQTPRDEANTAR
jgi:hypothetical protein